MTMFCGKPEHKILAWRDFRNVLNNWPSDIERVAQAWAKAPLSGNYLEFDSPKLWPDPWTLINDGIFCDISIVLGMFYTLYYSNYPNKNSMKIQQYKLTAQHQILNLLSLEDGKYMLNYNLNESVNIASIKQLPAPSYIVTARDLSIKG